MDMPVSSLKKQCCTDLQKIQRHCTVCGFLNEHFSAEILCSCGRAFLPKECFCASCGRRKRVTSVRSLENTSWHSFDSDDLEPPRYRKRSNTSELLDTALLSNWGIDNLRFDNFMGSNLDLSNSEELAFVPGSPTKGLFCKLCEMTTFEGLKLCLHCKEMSCSMCWQEHNNEMKAFVSDTVKTIVIELGNLESFEKKLFGQEEEAYSKCDETCNEIRNYIQIQIEELRNNMREKLDQKFSMKHRELSMFREHVSPAKKLHESAKECLISWGFDHVNDAKIYKSCKNLLARSRKSYESFSDVPMYIAKQRCLKNVTKILMNAFELSMPSKIKQVKSIEQVQDLDILHVDVSPNDEIIMIIGNFSDSKVLQIFNCGLTNKRKQTAPGTRDKAINGIACGTRKIYVCADNDVLVFDYRLKFIEKLNISDGITPLDIAVDVFDDTAFVLSDKAVSAYGPDGTQLRVFSVGRGESISVCGNGNLLIYGFYRDAVVHRYTNDGNELPQMVLLPTNKDIISVKCLVSDDEGSILAVTGTNEAILYLKNGISVRKVELPGFEVGVAGISVFRNGTILIASQNGKFYFL